MHRALLIGIVLALLAAAAVAALYQRDLSRAVAGLEGRSQRVDTGFGPIEYATAGEGAPALVIHGSGGGFGQGLLMAEPLGALGYRLIAPSRFGYLGTPARADMTIEMQADAHAALMDRLGIDRAVIVGGSAGALSALQLAIRHPERCEALVLLVPASYSPERRPHESGARSVWAERFMMAALRADFLFWAAIHALPGTMTRLILATEPDLIDAAVPQEKARAWQILDDVFPVSRRAGGLLFDSRTAGDPPPMELDRIRCPVLAVSAEDDLYGTAASARYIAANVPDGELLIYPTGGHLLVGHGDEIWRKAASFIESAREGRRPRRRGES